MSAEICLGLSLFVYPFFVLSGVQSPIESLKQYTPNRAPKQETPENKGRNALFAPAQKANAIPLSAGLFTTHQQKGGDYRGRFRMVMVMVDIHQSRIYGYGSGHCARMRVARARACEARRDAAGRPI